MSIKFDASLSLKSAQEKHQIKLEMLVVETAIWAHPNVHARLMADGSAARYPHIRRAKARKDTLGQSAEELRFDNNSYANITIKWAIGARRGDIVGYETCHIWPGTCYDERYHTAVANLVLLPRALAGLTDHLPYIQKMLQYRAHELYGWYPEEFELPQRPESYLEVWRSPEPDNLKVRKEKNQEKKTRIPYDSCEEVVLPIILNPQNSTDFKQALLINRMAEIEIFYTNGKKEKETWNASRSFTSTSNVLGNLRSRPKFRKGKWQELGIEKIHVSVINSTNSI